MMIYFHFYFKNKLKMLTLNLIGFQAANEFL